MGNRITAALICLNAVGFLGCLILIATVSYQVPDVSIWIIRAIHYSLQMFIFGALLPVIVWAIAASEINRSSFKVRLVEDWARYFLLFVSGALFFIAASRLPNSIISSSGHDPSELTTRQGADFGSVHFWGNVDLLERLGLVEITPATRRAFSAETITEKSNLVVRKPSLQGVVRQPSLLLYLGVGSRSFVGSGSYREGFNDR